MFPIFYNAYNEGDNPLTTDKKEETIMLLLLGISLMTIMVVMDYYEMKEKKERYESYLVRR